MPRGYALIANKSARCPTVRGSRLPVRRKSAAEIGRNRVDHNGKICTPPAKDLSPVAHPACYFAGMKTFLVPVDFSSITEQLIDSATSFARAFNGKVVLVHIVQAPVIASAEYALPADVIQEAVTVSRNASQKKMTFYTELFQKAGIECSGKTLIGAPVPLILDESAKSGADFILMGSHGHGKLYDFLVGSTASGVIKEARCGVVIMPPEDKAG
jgi:nucleotide-binding universal stress UspA family protein